MATQNTCKLYLVIFYIRNSFVGKLDIDRRLYWIFHIICLHKYLRMTIQTIPFKKFKNLSPCNYFFAIFLKTILGHVINVSQPPWVHIFGMVFPCTKTTFSKFVNYSLCKKSHSYCKAVLEKLLQVLGFLTTLSFISFDPACHILYLLYSENG